MKKLLLFILFTLYNSLFAQTTRIEKKPAYPVIEKDGSIPSVKQYTPPSIESLNTINLASFGGLPAASAEGQDGLKSKDISVNYNIGSPNITIPLYNFAEGGIQIPLAPAALKLREIGI